MFPISCTNRRQSSDHTLPVQLDLLLWAGMSTPTLGATTYTHLRKAPKTTMQQERYSEPGTQWEVPTESQQEVT